MLAAKIGKQAFFALETSTHPKSGLPPLIKYLSIVCDSILSFYVKQWVWCLKDLTLQRFCDKKNNVTKILEFIARKVFDNERKY